MSGRDTTALRRSWLPWIPLAFVVVVALAVGVFGSRPPQTNEDRVTALARTIKCPECRGESVAESNVAISKEARLDIANQVAAGRTDDQIYAFYAGKWGDAILLTPTSSGVTGLVWILPVVALVCALVALGFTFRRWSERVPVAATQDDRDLVAEALAHGHDRDREAGRDGGSDA
jgi:cytochrome c-type biogenesis protein CcmH